MKALLVTILSCSLGIAGVDMGTPAGKDLISKLCDIGKQVVAWNAYGEGKKKVEGLKKSVTDQLNLNISLQATLATYFSYYEEALNNPQPGCTDALLDQFSGALVLTHTNLENAFTEFKNAKDSLEKTGPLFEELKNAIVFCDLEKAQKLGDEIYLLAREAYFAVNGDAAMYNNAAKDNMANYWPEEYGACLP